jgi:hypothetical protein
MIDLAKALGEFVETVGAWFIALVAEYDRIYGHPWGRLRMTGLLCLGFAFWCAVLSLVF